MRIALACSWIKPDLFHQMANALIKGAALGDAVDQQWLADDLGDGHAWIKRAEGVLEHHAQLAARCRKGRSLGACQIGDIAIGAAIEDFPGTRIDQSHDRAAHRRFLADDPECLPRQKRDRDIIESTDLAEGHRHIAQFEDRRRGPVERWSRQPDFGLPLELQHRADQHARVIVLRRMKDLLDRAVLFHHAIVHDEHIVGDLGDHAHVVGDEQYRHAVGLLQPGYEIEDFGLGRDVERRRRLVGDQKLRLAGKRHGDHGALAHAARILESVTIYGFFRGGDFHLFQQ